MSNIAINTFIKKEVSNLERFATWWRENRSNGSNTDWPLQAPGPEWREQFQLFMDANSRGEIGDE